jgi:phenylalanyl-tRNA synthetase alpha chain
VNTPSKDVERILQEFANTTNWWQPPAAASDLLDLAKQSLDLYEKQGRWVDWVKEWFGQEQSIFWRAWKNIQRPGKADAIWGMRPLRELLLFPAEQAIQLGLLSATSVDVLDRYVDLRAYFDSQAAFSIDQERLKVIQLLWQSREGILSRLSENWLKRAKPHLKRTIGQSFNKLKSHIETTLESRRAAIESQAAKAWATTQPNDEANNLAIWRAQQNINLRAVSEAATIEESPIYVPRDVSSQPHIPEDLSLPGVMRPLGSRHPLRQTFEEIERIFLSLGYSVVAGPEMETSYYNFEALNIPEHHPARDNMDTFYMAAPPGASPLLLRTHTSPMQVRTMEKQQPPVRIIVPGKVYRRDNPDATHGFMFQQIEGLAVDTGITFCDFKGTVEYFVREFFGPKVKTRLRPSYFPFTEPSVEVDATCVFCGGKGCNVCKQSGWIELFGAGMVDPAVYGFVNYDPKRFSGFAFGMGVERMTQLKYNINDLQLYFQNDVRFLRQFA